MGEFDWLQALIDANDQPVFALDRELRYTAFNRAHADVMRALYGAEIAIGESILDYQTVEDDRRTAQANLDRALRGERIVEDAFSGEEARSRPSFKVTHEPISSDGVIIGVMVQALDVTEGERADTQREAHDYLENLFGYANAPVIVWDPELRITRFNHAFEELTQRTADEVVGKHLELLFPEDERRTQALAHVTQASAGERWQVVEIPIMRADGEVRTVLWNSATVYAADGGTPVATIAQGQDITERVIAERALADNEDKFQYMFDHSAVPRTITRPSGEIEVNEAFLEMVGLTREEIGEHATWQQISHPDDVAQRERIIASIISGECASARFEQRYLHKNGAVIWADVSTALRRDADGNADYFMTTIVDITERKHAEEEVRRLNAELEQRILERTAQLDAANKELEAFAYSVSHDLRAPLRHISGFASILMEDAGDALDENGRDCLATITESVREMGVLIDDLLQFSRVGRVEMQITDVNMEEILSEALRPIREETADRAIEWSIGTLPHVLGDHALLRQVWANLVGNAVKYSRDRSPARIEIGALDGRAGSRDCVFFVRDNGVGFDMQYADKLFRVFQRLHSSAEFEGTGIGLANAQRIVTRLGGRVWAKAELDQGATFSFALPRTKEARC